MIDNGATQVKPLMGELYEIYYENRDLRLLLDLLAATSGLAPPLRYLTNIFLVDFNTWHFLIGETTHQKLKLYSIAENNCGISLLKIRNLKNYFPTSHLLF
jgi:hypothetical protein